MDDRLRFLLQNVAEWLKFAEAKNGVLIAFNGAAIWGILQGIGNICNDHLILIIYIFMTSSSLAIVISLFSFMPDLHLSRKRVESVEPEKIESHSVIFFGHVGKLNPDEYLEYLYRRAGDNKPDKFNYLEKDLAYQIVTNSRIAHFKYRMFFVALSVTLMGMILPLPFVIISWVLRWLKK